MAKRKKYPKLPNGYGSIKYLGKGRRNPYGVYPPCPGFTLEGIPISQKALCYVDDWMVGFAILTAYKAGTYTPGMEKDLKLEPGSATDSLAQKILADYNRAKGTADTSVKQKTFAEVYEDYFDYKYNQSKKEYSKSAIGSTKAAYKNCKVLHARPFAELRHPDLQAVIDNCPLKHASLELIVTLMHQMYEYAMIYEIVDKNYSAAVKIRIADDDEHGEPFTEADLAKLWAQKSDPIVEMILIMCYSGYRIKAYETLDVHTNEMYFQGGVKTKTSKKRIVPIHSAILPLVKARIQRYGKLLPTTPQSFRTDMYNTLKRLGIEKHTPHDCRHTFSMLCEEYEVNDNDRKRMLGHSFGRDITNGIYGHRTLEDLRTEIEKIKICC